MQLGRAGEQGPAGAGVDQEEPLGVKVTPAWVGGGGPEWHSCTWNGGTGLSKYPLLSRLCVP